MELQTMPLKFRVWDTKEKKFVVGKEVFDYLLSHIMYWTDYGFCLDTERFIVSQDTGLKDRNGEEIFFGDILDYGHYSDFAVKQRNSLVSMGRLYDSDGDDNGQIWSVCAGDSSLLDVTDQASIIGNIWQNPELLKK